MSGSDAKSIENNATDCDNPISLDEIEKGLWLGVFNLNNKLLSTQNNCNVSCVLQEVSLLHLMLKR